MKQTIIAVFIALTITSCGNSGDDNTNDLNSIKTDSSLNNSADTIQNPGTGSAAPTPGNPDTLSNSGSNDQKNQTMKDSSKTKQ